MTLKTFGPHEVGLKYHVKWPTPKHVENSIRGSKYAKRHGYRTTDLDMLPDEDLVLEVKHLLLNQTLSTAQIAGHIRNTHWDNPFRRDEFRDPKRILGPGDLMSSLSAEELNRLVAGRFPRYHMPTIEEQFAVCGEIGLQALIEPKRSIVWMYQPVWDYLAYAAERRRCHTAVYSLMHECLPYARRAGFTAWAI